MPRVAIPVTRPNRGGVALSTVAGDPTNDHSVASGVPERLVLVITNNDTASQTVQLPLSVAPDGQAVTPRSVSVPAGATRYVGPFTKDYVQADGTIHVDVTSNQLSLGALFIE